MKCVQTFCFVFISLFGGALFSQNVDSILFFESGFKQVTVNLHFVYTKKNQVLPEDVGEQLASAFKDAKVSLDIKKQNFTNEYIPNLFSIPSGNKITFTRQMRKVRDLFFKDKQASNDNDYFIFLINSFSDTSLLSFALPNKHVLFVKYSNSSNFIKSIGSCLMRAKGVSILSDTSTAALDDLSQFLTWKERLALRQSNSFFSVYDDYEFTTLNNGLVAYYLWKVDKNGKIISGNSSGLLNNISRPFKLNDAKIYLKIENPLFWPIYRSTNWILSPLHLLVVVLVLVLLILLRKKVNKRIIESRWYKRWSFRIIKVLAFFVSIALVYWSFILVNKYYTYRFLENYHFSMFNGYSAQKVTEGLGKTPELIKVAKEINKTEIIVNHGGRWVAKMEGPVLYFDEVEGKNGTTSLFFRYSSNKLVVKGNKIEALNHYMVVTRRSSSGGFISQNMYDYQGKQIDKSVLGKSPTKRILLFVNGYRPVSTSSDLEETYAAIKSKGIEMPASGNYIYDNDRFAYWTPWKKINYLFENRIHPDDIYYADGHHSISTSNHVSILNFTNTMSFFPKRCPNLKAHVCTYVKNITKDEVLSKSLLPITANTRGFNIRKMNGRKAGYNFLQLLNNVPNSSSNDTLYIVAHSMGYAYSLGIVEVLKHRIKFGGFYIIAPENACSGEVNADLWSEVWQYGAKLTGNNADAMCLQDGIAPQSNARGLNQQNIVHFPKEMDKMRGFSGSHFIGNYTWLFDIPQGKNGAVKAN